MNPSSTPPSKSFTRFFPIVARILLGFVFFAAGLTYFLMKPPESPMPAGAKAFSDALQQSGYLMQLLKATETVAGALVLFNRFVPLALAVLAPIIVNITAFLIFLMPSMAAMGMVLVALELYLAWSYRSAFRPMLGSRVSPG